MSEEQAVKKSGKKAIPPSATSREYLEFALKYAEFEQPHDGSERERKYANYIEALKSLVSMAYGLTY